MAKEWPPQDTGVFAVPPCVQCCNYVPLDKYEIANTNVSQYLMVGVPGFDGLADVLYRTASWEGGFSIRYSLLSDCSDTASTSVVQYSGSSTRNLGDFVTSTGTLIGTKDGTDFAYSDANGPGIAMPPCIPAAVTPIQTTVTDSLVGTGQCVGFVAAVYHETVTGSGTSTLSNVCTEEVSLAWRENQTPGWGDWVDAPMADWFDYVLLATYQASTPGVEGQYSWYRMKYRRTKGGFAPGANYVCTMEVYRAPANTYDFELYATLEETLVADMMGNLIMEGEAPFARGYSTWVKARSFTATPA